MIEKLALPEIRELLTAGDAVTLREVLNRWDPSELVGLIEELDNAGKVDVLRALRVPLAAQVFEYLDVTVQESLIELMPDDQSAPVLESMSADDRTALLEELPAERATRLIAQLSPAQRAIAESLLRYSPDSVGRLMTPDYLAVRKEWTVKHVLDYVRTHGRDSDTLNVVYVVDQDHRLIDDLRIRYVLLAPLHALVRDITDGHFVALNVNDAKKTAVEAFRKNDRTVLPVTDPRGSLVGIVTIDDVLDVAEEEATREIQKFGGQEALDEPYVTTPLLSMVKKRASWLVVLFLGEMLTASALGHFQQAIVAAPVLALFVPLIISSGGNSGSQAATLIIRALALKEVALRDFRRVLGRELFSGLMLGALLATIGFLRIFVWTRFSTVYGPDGPSLALAVSISILGVVLWGTLTGATLPFLLKRFGIDPATASAPFVATVVDVTGVIIYFNVAYFVLSRHSS